MLSPRESAPLDHPSFRGRRRAVIAFAVMSLVILGQVWSARAGPSPPGTAEDAKARCMRLLGATFGPARVTAANFVDASVGGGATQQGHCVAQASKIDQPDFEMEAQLPADWDGVIVHGGGGGLDGFIPAGLPWAPAQPVDQGMVFLASNGGHQGDPRKDWGKNLAQNPRAMTDYIYGAISSTDEFGDAVVAAYYGRQPRKRYFVGCSKGGFDALQAASLYGDRYDGVVAQAPAPNLDGFIARANSLSRLPPVREEIWHALYEAYVRQCDALDGLKDGVVSNPHACAFDPSSVSGVEPSELKTILSLTSDLVLADGTLVNRRYAWAPEFDVFGLLRELGRQWMIYPILDDPSFDAAASTLDRDWKSITAATAAYPMKLDPDRLAIFLKHGKKILIFMGREDSMESVDDAIDLERAMESRSREAARNSLMFLLPGVTHCAQYPSGASIQGGSGIDMLAMLRHWVEQDSPPSHPVVARKDAKGIVINTRPLCRLGYYPRYRGSGDTSKAESFSCVAEPSRLSRPAG
jgi:pimeloyl-ACP methyl ester carboxylesterase